MRRWTLSPIVLVLALALASVAFAKFSQVANVTLTGHQAGKTTGIRSDVGSSDPTAPGQKPKSATSLAITFPAGTRFNLRTPMVTTCRLSERQLAAQFGRSCPNRSLIGTGTAVANASPLAQTVKAAVRAYVGRPDGDILLVVKPSLPGSPTIVIRAVVSGARLTIPLPRLVLGKGPGFPGVTVVFVALKLNVPALGHGGSALITAGACTAHEFVVTSHFRYADHTTLDLPSSSRCT